ncbi:TlpA family protein disulfide reductase [Flavivirga jejuensis]|uniref:TlpA disulfide reductase family protein n=1 Tax=Flavivirga jejuensis TaxID=870487 RepID=A0ABT8WVM7_9FLAO|nr:TlpA disulfide reductase family protein [Flavivirga jejuensis]MDO5977065.1 TlpA disulfide reductase family protein [Flavivirga jejuensis]
MNIKEKHNKVKRSRLEILLLVFASIIINIHAQEKQTDIKNRVTEVNRDLKALMLAKGGMGYKGYKKACDLGFLEMRKYEDSVFKESSRLAKAFWSKYRDDQGSNFAFLFEFFGVSTRPYFLPDNISDSIKQLIKDTSRKDRRLIRLLPVDIEAMEQWRQMGDSMVSSMLNSNASLEYKETVEFQLISRKFHDLLKLNSGLTKDKAEKAYWNRFEVQFWEPMRSMLENHVSKYAKLNIVATRVQNILNLIGVFSETTQEVYWNYFYKTTGSDHLQADMLGIRTLHKMAKDNVTAIETLKEVDYTKPLEMAFTAMDGSKVNLADMRGKVVLIDFWATYCAPCIKEMPHIRALYDKYKNQGFEVVGIVADGDGAKDQIFEILKKNKANWPQFLDGGDNVSVSYHALYKIKALPTVWLLNKDGVIVNRNARGASLEPLVRKYLDLK